MKIAYYSMFLLILLSNCDKPINKTKKAVETDKVILTESHQNHYFNNKKYEIAHVLVSLCDNKYQGIVKVPEGIGNGQDARNNLYWGCAYGVKTYLRNQAHWTIMETEKNVNDTILERVIFQHKNGKNILIADAYNGQFFKSTTDIYLKSLSAQIAEIIVFNQDTIGIYGNANLLAFIGHNGLMEFDLPIENYESKNNRKRSAIILACISQSYFQPYLKKLKVEPLLLSTGLMSPEAYTLDAALIEIINQSDKSKVRLEAAKAYDKFQKCGINGALGLLVN
jgi:hypothetical protein